VTTLAKQAETALANGTEAVVEAELARWLAANGPDLELLQWRALLLRALDRRAEAVVLLETAARLAPDDPAVAHSLAQTSQEAGLKAAALFETALRLNPANPDIRRGFIAANQAEGNGLAMLDMLAAGLDANPGWFDGHRQYAQLANQLGLGERALETLDRAAQRFPDQPNASFVAIDLLAAAANNAAVLERAEALTARSGDIPAVLLAKAAALGELGQGAAARALFARLGEPADPKHAVNLVRHHLRDGEPKAALKVAEPWLASEFATQLWPYVGLAWRVLGNQQADWFEGQAGLVRTFDLDLPADRLTALAERLRSVHAGSGRFMDQSVRGGTQTDGPLFARIEPEIVQIRQAMADAFTAHLAGLPPLDDRHPQLALARDQAPRFAGSWSVRLVDEGFHASHHHPQGWFSAVFYVTVPANLAQTDGQLALGAAPPELGLGLDPVRLVEPIPGRLAIFPSTMWHGTFPFSKGERMTIAFDLARPFAET
jgi:tetratricopeptide (TPR) repeat protein